MSKFVLALAFLVLVNDINIFVGHVQVEGQNTNPITKELNAREKAIQEIKELRQEISSALEKDEEKQNAQRKDVITQPAWTKLDFHIFKKKTEKPVSSSISLKEAKRIRMEIANAVSKQTYAVGRHNESDIVAKADHYLGMKFRMKNLVSSVLAQAGEQNEDVSTEDLEFNEDNIDSNVIESHIFHDDDFDGYHWMESALQRRDKDILVLKSIEENFNSQISAVVTEWKFVTDSNNKCLVGLQNNSILVVFIDEDLQVKTNKSLQFEGSISSFDTTNILDIHTKKHNGFIIVAINNTVQWFQISNVDMPIYTLKMENSVISFQFFEIEDHYIALSQSHGQRAYILIYKINIITKDLWLVQRISTKSPTLEIVFLDTGRDVVLACIQEHTVLLYMFEPKTDFDDYINFELSDTFQSTNVNSITGFQMGGYSYIAFGGLDPKILRYNRGKFVSQTIFGSNFGYVSLFLPISARTYRDDLILLIQHEVEFETHNLTTLEALVWDGEAFVASLPVPCVSNDLVYTTGIECLLDEQRVSGLKGAAVFESGRNISIIVPRFEKISGVYEIHTELLSKNIETSDLELIYEFLKDWINEQEEVVNKSIQLINATNSEALHITEVQISGEISQIYVNDDEWIDLDSSFNLTEIIEELEFIEKEISLLQFEDNLPRNKRQLPFSEMVMTNVHVNDLFVKNVNMNLVNIVNGNLNFSGTVQLDDGLILKQDLSEMSSFDAKKNDFMVMDTLISNYNLNFEYINDIPWNKWISNLVMTDLPCNITEIMVKGEVLFENSLEIHHLNNLKFPEHYLWADGDTSSIVKAEKNFLNSLLANSIDTEDSINGVNLGDIITLSNTQNIPGQTTFAHLEVSEELELKGTVLAKSLDHFLPNQNILDGKFIQSNCQFTSLKVLGSLNVLNSIDSNNPNLLLNDVILKTDQNLIEITSQKSMVMVSSVENSTINVLSNRINGIPLNQFVDQNSDQIMMTENIKGNVYFNYLNVKGHFDFVNITELAHNSIKINENQKTSAMIAFSEDTEFIAQELHIVEYLNNNTVNDFLTTSEKLWPFESNFSKIFSNKLEVLTDLRGRGLFNDISLKTMKSKNQGLKHKPNNSTVLKINDLFVEEIMIDASDFVLTFLKKINSMSTLITAGHINIETMTISGNVSTNKLNGQLFNEFQSNLIWLNRPNFFQANVEFLNRTEIRDYLEIQNFFNNQNFTSYCNEVIFRSNIQSSVISKEKKFTDVLKVKNNVEIGKINSVPFERLAKKQSRAHFLGKLHIQGDISVSQIIVKYLNKYDANNLENLMHYNNSLEAFVINGLVQMKGVANINNLFIKNSVNSIKNVDHFIGHLVNKYNICFLNGRTIFENAVVFEKGAVIVKINGVNLEDFYRSIVFTNGSQAIQVKGPLKFTNAITAKNIEIRDSLYTSNLMGIALHDMIENSLRLNLSSVLQGNVQIEAGNLDGNKLIAHNLNRKSLLKLWTINSSQNFSGALQLNKLHLHGAITSTNGLVNGFNMLDELKNTLLTVGNQNVKAPTTMQSLRVLRNLQTEAEVNRKNLSNVATLFEDLTFHSPLSFNCVTTNVVFSNDEITGINFTSWFWDSLWSIGRIQQVIKGSWSFANVSVNNQISGNNVINEMHLQDISRSISSASIDKQTMSQLETEYLQTCNNTTQLIEKSQNFVYFVKYFQESFKVKEADFINLIKFFYLNHSFYMLTNVGCLSTIYAWENTKFRNVAKFESGIVEQILMFPMLNENAIKFATTSNIRSGKHCNIQGGNIWKFQTGNVSHLKTFDEAGDVGIIHQPSFDQNDRFYGLDDVRHAVIEYSIATEDEQKSWNIPGDANKNYHFLPSDAELGVTLSDGKQIFVVHQSKGHQLKETNSARLDLHHTISKETPYSHSERTEDIEETNANSSNITINDINWSLKIDYLVVKILEDLLNKLNQILNESHMDFNEEYYEERFICRDFIDILEELKSQNLFADNENLPTYLELQNQTSLGNLGELYVIKTVKTLWSHIKEIEEINANTTSKDDPDPILTYLLHEITSIVSIADFRNRNWYDAKTKRIENYIKKLRDNIYDGIRKNSNATIAMLNEPIIGQAIPERNLFATENSYLPNRNSGEVFALKVGSPENRRNLIVTIVPRVHLVGDENQNFIHIYYDIIQGELFQSLPVHKPRSLTALHIQDETILAYIEDKYVVQTYIFRGIQGFVKLAKFKSNRYITSMTSVTKESNHECPKNFLVLNVENAVIFYQAVMSGKCSFYGKFKCWNL